MIVQNQLLKNWSSLRLERKSFLLWGSALLTLKMYVDALISWVVFDQHWTPFHYLSTEQVRIAVSGIDLESPYYITMLLASIPFVVVGVFLTLLRLRAASLPLWLTFLFFLPMINLLFFVVLCALPSTDSTKPIAKLDGASAANDTWQEQATKTDFLAAVLVGSLLGLGLVNVNIYAFRVYGAGLFVGLPFCIGLVTPMLVRRDCKVSFAQSLGGAALAVFLTALGTVLTAMDGFLCLIMAAPLWLVCALMGGFVAHSVQSRVPNQRWSAILIVVLMLLLPALMCAEATFEPQAPVYKAHTSVYVRAPVERVWASVVSFPDLNTPDNWFFHFGVAYPIGASINGAGVGAIRRCRFSTGDFVEPITVWEEPFRLAFDVTENPPPMREWSPFEGIHPPHLDGYFVSKRGEFRLIPISGELTLLEGTTWYQQRMWPTEYWRFWTNMMIQAIHQTVLEHVRVLSENERNFKI
jgi:hypothetical protein